MSELARCAKCKYFAFLSEPCWQCGAPIGDKDPAKSRRRYIVWILMAFVLVMLIINAIINRL